MLLQFQFTADRVINEAGSLHMAGCAGADPYRVPAGMLMPELGIKSRDSCDLGGRDPRGVTNPFQGIFREIMELLLNILEDRDHSLSGGPVNGNDPVDDGVNIFICQIRIMNIS